MTVTGEEPADRAAAVIFVPDPIRKTIPGEEPDGPIFDSLSELVPDVEELVGLLEEFGFAVKRPKDADLRADVLWSTFDLTLAGGRDDDVRIVHVLGHGELGDPSGQLRLIGADGAGAEPSIDALVAGAADRRDGPRVLFVLDTCHAGAAAELPWQIRGADDESRAWVIAASSPDQKAFDGRLTKALTRTLQEAKAGTLGQDPSVPFLPWALVRDRVISHVELAGACSLAQRVRSTLLDRTVDPPFFPNPKYLPDLFGDDGIRAVSIDSAYADLVRAVDRDVDLVHFIDRAAGRRSERAPHAAYFSGRELELEQLSRWLDDAEPPNTLQVVTGSPGCGKSALLGMVLCAGHPALREQTRLIWQRASSAPSQVEGMVAVHSRERTTEEVARSVARQLGIDIESGTRPVHEGLLTGLADRRTATVVMVDAVDEARDPTGLVNALLLPAASLAARSPHLRVVVGSRSGPGWPMLGPLLDTAGRDGVIDLDAVEPARLRAEMYSYVVARLADEEKGWSRLRHRVAEVLADALSAATDGAVRQSAFLVAGVYLNYLTRQQAPVGSSEENEILSWIPLTLQDVLELDLDKDSGEVRAVLAALAWAKGEGMPLGVTTAVAKRLAAPGLSLDAARVLAGLDQARFYLRRTVDSDGTHL